MTLIPVPGPWVADAACADRPASYTPQQWSAFWFPERGNNVGGDGMYAIARAICNRCPVRQACLEHAIAAGERHGLWGGMTERERQRLRVTRRSSGADRIPLKARKRNMLTIRVTDLETRECTEQHNCQARGPVGDNIHLCAAIYCPYRTDHSGDAA